MKVLIVLAFAAIAVSAQLQSTPSSIPRTTGGGHMAPNGSVIATTIRSFVMSNNSTQKPQQPKPKHCHFVLKHMHDIQKAFGKCENLTGFPGNLTNSAHMNLFHLPQAKNFEDHCFGKCVLEKLKLYKNDGDLKKDEFKKMIKSNATSEIEKERKTGWMKCLENIEAGPKVTNAYCKHPIKLISCGMKVEHDVFNNCH